MRDVQAALPDSFPIQDALAWLDERGLTQAVVFDEDGRDVGLLDLPALLQDLSWFPMLSLHENILIRRLLRALPKAASYREKLCPIDGVCMARQLDEDDKDGKYFCPRHRVYHCTGSC